jgi:GT2 family glycosyltransferase
MAKPDVSILISTHDRLPLWRRTLWFIARFPPPLPYELVVVDDNSEEDVLGELKKYSSVIPWKFARFDQEKYERATNQKKFFNNPAATTNLAFTLSEGNLIIQQGQEVIATSGCYASLVDEAPRSGFYLCFSQTFDVPKQILGLLNDDGSNMTWAVAAACERWPLQTEAYRSDVTNYVSLTPRSLWEEIGGYDERYYQGISAEDSDFVRRARATGRCPTVISRGVSLHQSHGGRTAYYWPEPGVITRERFDEGCRINRAVYDSWDGSHANPQAWPLGLGLGEFLTNTR